MYIRRPEHEKELKRSVEGSLHTIVCGESGSGKTWLYKHVSEKEGWQTFYANASNASRLKSLTTTIVNATLEAGDKEMVEYTQKLAASVGAFGFGGGADAARKYEVTTQELLIKAFENGRKRAGKKTAVLVIDNLESIFSKRELMEELGNIILLLDDAHYAIHNIKILIIGIPADVVEYYQSTDNLEPVTNRLHELPTISSLKRPQVIDFAKRGFVDNLKVKITDDQIEILGRHIHTVTLGVAQRMHEYCEILAHQIQDNGWIYGKHLIAASDNRYMGSCLKKSYSVIDGFMNTRKAKTARRNQVLYALGKTYMTEFYISEVELLVREEFPESTRDITLSINQIMTDLCAGNAPLLRRTLKSVSYRFVDARHLMCLRIMLQKADGEKVVRGRLAR